MSTASAVSTNPLAGITRLTYRTMRVIQAVAEQPGASNYEISRRAGVSDQGQISKLLGRLARLGLLANTGDGQAKGLANAWRLTSRGRQVNAAIARELAGSWQSRPDG
jgi:DNA-binding IclR family transcriptional regulator